MYMESARWPETPIVSPRTICIELAGLRLIIGGQLLILPVQEFTVIFRPATS